MTIASVELPAEIAKRFHNGEISAEAPEIFGANTDGQIARRLRGLIAESLFADGVQFVFCLRDRHGQDVVPGSKSVGISYAMSQALRQLPE